MIRLHPIAVALALSLVAAPAFAEEIKAGDLTIEKPWARATPKGAEVGAAYVEIRNAGGEADKLTGGSADFANVEIHEMSMQGNVMKMQELKHPLVKGETAKLTLTFAHAGAVTVDFPVVGLGASSGETKGMNMNGMKM